jgi:hypothetical protein
MFSDCILLRAKAGTISIAKQCLPVEVRSQGARDVARRGCEEEHEREGETALGLGSSSARWGQ